MKLSIKLVLLAGILAAFCPTTWAATFKQDQAMMSAMPRSHIGNLFGEVGLGLGGGERSAGPAFQLRTGYKLRKNDLSIGFLNLYNQKPHGLRSEDAALPTINFELTRVFLTDRLDEVAIGGGAGFTMPNTAGGTWETADNDVSFTALASFTKYLTRRYAVSFSVRGFFFNTDSHFHREESHMETFTINGVPSGQIEVIDQIHENNSINFNSVLFFVSLRWE